MAKVLVNWIYDKSKDEYKILNNFYVYADQKVAVLETEEDIDIPLIVPINGALTVVDRTKYEEKNKKFFIATDKSGNVFENPKGVGIWLPKDTDISQLKVINGQLVKVETQQEEPKEDIYIENVEEKEN